jgi:hypothetical protein
MCITTANSRVFMIRASLMLTKEQQCSDCGVSECVHSLVVPTVGLNVENAGSLSHEGHSRLTRDSSISSWLFYF